MARFTRKIKKNMEAPRLAAEEEAKDIAASQPHNRQFRSWEVYVIAGIMALTLFMVAGSWEMLDTGNRIMYIILIITLGLMYMQRRMTTLTANQSLWLGRAVIALLSSSVGIFIYNSYNTYTSK